VYKGFATEHIVE
jgi:hypothetical protein